MKELDECGNHAGGIPGICQELIIHKITIIIVFAGVFAGEIHKVMVLEQQVRVLRIQAVCAQNPLNLLVVLIYNRGIWQAIDHAAGL